MASKASRKTPNTELIANILDDQASLMLEHLSHGHGRKDRLIHNINELLHRLGEPTMNPTEPLFFQ